MIVSMFGGPPAPDIAVAMELHRQGHKDSVIGDAVLPESIGDSFERTLLPGGALRRRSNLCRPDVQRAWT